MINSLLIIEKIDLDIIYNTILNNKLNPNLNIIILPKLNLKEIFNTSSSAIPNNILEDISSNLNPNFIIDQNLNNLNINFNYFSNYNSDSNLD